MLYYLRQIGAADEAVARATEFAVADHSASLMPGSAMADAPIGDTAAALNGFAEATQHGAWTDATTARQHRLRQAVTHAKRWSFGCTSLQIA